MLWKASSVTMATSWWVFLRTRVASNPSLEGGSWGHPHRVCTLQSQCHGYLPLPGLNTQWWLFSHSKKANFRQHWAPLTPTHWDMWAGVLTPGRQAGLGPWSLRCAQAMGLVLGSLWQLWAMSPCWACGAGRDPSVVDGDMGIITGEGLLAKGRRQWQVSLQKMICLWLPFPNAAKRSFKMQLRLLRKSLFL